MNAQSARRFAILFDRWYAILSRCIFISPSASWLEVEGNTVTIEMGWAFHCTIAREAICRVKQENLKPLSRGVHGFAGQWLINGSAHNILAITLSPPQQGYVCGFPVRLKKLWLSLEEPDTCAHMFHQQQSQTAQDAHSA